MKLTRLRIVGFKTFVEPTDVPIEPGLTGVVGPNGCGKSNLVEALRWVMGESSHKNMRAAGMDDVIFAGSSGRPARNTAEVMLAIDNVERGAPAAFNDADHLEVSRKIEREHGSAYRVNGREVRARDVQLLFADAASGARSPALVRQGQIAELIAAKPQARRRILEDAAGIAGLHARRHEAELRLKGAEDNLIRVEDVLREIDAQVETLRKQDRQAQRFRAISSEIRQIEAQLQAAGFLHARAQLDAVEAASRDDMNAVAERTAEQAVAARAQAIAAHELQPLREAEAAAAASLRRVSAARIDLDHQERRARERLAELERRTAEIERDGARQSGLGADAASTIARLGSEATEITRAEDDAGRRRQMLEAENAEAQSVLASAEGVLAEIQGRVSDLKARRETFEREAKVAEQRVTRLLTDRQAILGQIASRERQAGEPAGPLRDAVAAAEAEIEAAETQAAETRSALARLREDEARTRQSLNEADRAASRIETELRTLKKLFVSPAGRWPTMLDQVTAAPGYETALAAALGDDLDASPEPGAPVRWSATGPGADDPSLPDGVAPLAGQVRAPEALGRRLRQIGIAERSEAALLARALRPGQRLVSREGDLWRWDGLSASAEAPSAAARRLAERNRLADLERTAGTARISADVRRAELDAAEARSREAAGREAAAIEGVKRHRKALDEVRERLAGAERRELEDASRRSALSEALSRLDADLGEAETNSRSTAALLAGTPDPGAAEAELLAARTEAGARRNAATAAGAALATLTREAELALRRRAGVASDLRLWTERAERAAAATAELAGRLATARRERDHLAAEPDAFILRRRALVAEIERLERQRRDAADRFAQGETTLAEADTAARRALEALAAARERRAGSLAKAEGLAMRVDEITRAIREAFDVEPGELVSRAGLRPGEAPPDGACLESRLITLKADRERLGGVNLRAEEELAETMSKSAKLAAERDDLVEAIRRLRGAVGHLNRDARERLNAAFGTVAGHFERLFTGLFGGGSAELALVDSDDPLEAGLEIMARPPGKKPATLSLLSGGEQALTAIALIFAVFLTNPSPICVLDEVDAPLDDANVERYCDLLRSMAGDTDTRFLVITHNPITMARMDRLFGVTMAERGISQLVSVDLQDAERLREVG